MTNYESVLVMEPALDKEAQKLFFQQTVRKIIRDFKGDITYIDSWGLRKLANKNRKRWAQALYFHFFFKGEKGVVEELIRLLRVDEKVLYFHFEKLKKNPQEHLRDFRSIIEEAIKKEKERLARIQKKKNFLAAKKGPGNEDHFTKGC